MTQRTCSIDGCPDKVVGWGYCDLHYRRFKKFGDPLKVLKPLRLTESEAVERMLSRGARPLEPYPGTAVPWRCECLTCGEIITPRLGPKGKTQGMCINCGHRIQGEMQRGSGNHAWKDTVGYYAAHVRHRKTLGPADQRACVDCGDRAGHWSYQGGDPDELVENGYPYSLDPTFYVPRCHSCHGRYDKGR